MVETNINAYKQELAIAERELDRAKSRVEGLKSYIKANDEPAVGVSEVTEQVEVSEEAVEPVTIKVKNLKKDKKGKKGKKS
jgi:hypothetical protein